MAESRVKRDTRSYWEEQQLELDGEGNFGNRAYLEIESKSGRKSIFGLSDGILCVSVKDVEVTDAIFTEEGACHAAVESMQRMR